VGLQGDACGGGGREPIDALEVFEHIRDITDPEHPYTLEQLNVVEERLIDVADGRSRVRCVVVHHGAAIKPQRRHRFKLRWVAGAYQMAPLALLPA
jgi:hypothetical protein